MPLIPIKYGIICIIDDVMNAIMYFLLVIVFAPQEDLSREEIVLLGMIMLTTMEFITYYGMGVFSGINGYNPQDFKY